jgi:hypothetical protein
MEMEQLLQKVCELLHYNPDTGVFTWKTNRGKGIKEGDIAGCITSQGYVQIYIENKPYLAHRLAYILTYKKNPTGRIDHINRNKTDNSIKNLRDVNAQVNALNTSSRGTHFSRNGWTAGLTINGKRKHLGYFSSEVEANCAYTKAKNDYLRRKYGTE